MFNYFKIILHITEKKNSVPPNMNPTVSVFFPVRITFKVIHF